jgi:signal transduction histidine kinase
MPRLTASLVQQYGLDAEDYAHLEALAVRSIIVVPFIVRDELTGCMLFASRRPYHQANVEFAERYASRVAVVFENAVLYHKAKDAIRARDEFLSMASHELRTPITSLRLFAEKLTQKASEMSSSTVAALGDRIRRQTARLDRMVGRLLDSCEIDAGRPLIEREKTDLRGIVDDVVQAFAEQATRAGSALVVSVPGSVLGYWDPLRLEQIIGNLVDNSIKFGPGKPIHIDGEVTDGRARLSVRDEGPGISKEDEEHVFDQYWRAGGEVRNLGGLGLGLYVAKEMANAHGGTLTLETTPGKGATFTLELPLDEPRDR